MNVKLLDILETISRKRYSTFQKETNVREKSQRGGCDQSQNGLRCTPVNKAIRKIGFMFDEIVLL